MQRARLKTVLLGFGWAASLHLGCGTAPEAAQPEANAPSKVAAPSLRKPPQLASTIYDVDCTTDADCVLVPQGDVCQCGGWGAIRVEHADKFGQRRSRLGARCAGGAAAQCTPAAALVQARCQMRQCVADAPRALACIDHVLDVSWPQVVLLGQTPTQSPNAALSACPGLTPSPAGDSEVFLLQPKAAGKYRIVITDRGPPTRPFWLVVREPDCQSDNVACRACTSAGERCVTDTVLGPDDTAVIVVRGCDGDCTLQVSPWDAATPLVPPL